MNDRHDSSSRDTPRRTEPVLGNLDQLDAEAGGDRRSAERAERAAASVRGAPGERIERTSASPRRPFDARPPATHPPRHRRRRWWPAVVVAVAIVVAGAWVFSNQSMLSALLPQTQLNSLLSRADKAYAAGKLTGGPDSARDLYEAVRVLDPDNEQALTGLQNVGDAELARARTALKQHDYTAARTALENARGLLGGGAGVQAVDQDLAKAVLHNANVDVLIGQARAALKNGHIDGADGAAALFGKVLAGAPDNPVARHGMDQIGDALATRIRTQLGNNDRAGARQTLDSLASLVPGYSQLPTLRANVAAADRAADAQRDQDLAQGQADLKAGKLTGAGDDNAEAQFKAALAADPGNAKAQAGLGQVASTLVAQANVAIAAGNMHDAKGLLDQATGLAPKSADLAAARLRLAAAGKQASGSAPAASGSESAALPVVPPVLTPAQSAKLAQLVASAKSAAQHGNIMLPPGHSAYDLYSAALAIDGSDAAAQAGLRGLPQVTRDQFEHALREGNLDHAHDLLATLDELDPGDPVEAAMRRRLGSAWLDRADHDATLGRSAAARTALGEAQRLVPQDPRISEISARIHLDD
ncbi:MAG: hypothetical protein ACREP0_00210 [Rhodanobacteraceae bacterium]